MSPTIVLVLIGVSLALVLGGVALLVPNLLRLPFVLIGAGIAALIRPIKRLFSKGGDSASGEAEKGKPGVEEVTPPVAAAAA